MHFQKLTFFPFPQIPNIFKKLCCHRCHLNFQNFPGLYGLKVFQKRNVFSRFPWRRSHNLSGKCFFLLVSMETESETFRKVLFSSGLHGDRVRTLRKVTFGCVSMETESESSSSSCVLCNRRLWTRVQTQVQLPVAPAVFLGVFPALLLIGCWRLDVLLEDQSYVDKLRFFKF